MKRLYMIESIFTQITFLKNKRTAADKSANA